VLVTLALFLALVWRVLLIARRAADAGLKYQSYMAAAFALWVGMQALINIGVNMGVLPTKGLTLPFMSYGRSSLLVTLAWLGVVLRIHHEVSVAGRGSASARRGGEET
jgi:cell division protein FtsW